MRESPAATHVIPAMAAPMACHHGANVAASHPDTAKHSKAAVNASPWGLTLRSHREGRPRCREATGASLGPSNRPTKTAHCPR